MAAQARYSLVAFPATIVNLRFVVGTKKENCFRLTGLGYRRDSARAKADTEVTLHFGAVAQPLPKCGDARQPGLF
jgi:hypothetical protein